MLQAYSLDQPSPTVVLSRNSSLLNLDQTLSKWDSVREGLALYLNYINSGPMGKIAPDITGIYEMYRRVMQTQLFVELGIAAKASVNIGLAINPVVPDGNSYSIPVLLVEGGAAYTTFEYAAWAARHQEFMNDYRKIDIINPGSRIRNALRYRDKLGLNVRLLEDNYEDLEYASHSINKLFLVNVRKYATSKGPHFYNMPFIQATMFDQGLNKDVFRRYILSHKKLGVLGYFVAEVTDTFYTIGHAMLNKRELSLVPLSMKQTLLIMLSNTLDTCNDGRRRRLFASRLLTRYLTKG